MAMENMVRNAERSLLQGAEHPHGRGAGVFMQAALSEKAGGVLSGSADRVFQRSVCRARSGAPSVREVTVPHPGKRGKPSSCRSRSETLLPSGTGVIRSPFPGGARRFRKEGERSPRPCFGPDTPVRPRYAMRPRCRKNRRRPHETGETEGEPVCPGRPGSLPLPYQFS